VADPLHGKAHPKHDDRDGRIAMVVAIPNRQER
jgi:hypothetical protein